MRSKLVQQTFHTFITRGCVVVAIRRSYSSPSYVHSIGSESLRALTIGSLLQQSAQKYGKREAVVSPHQQKILSFQNILEEADKFAAGLRALGVEKGDRVGIWAPNLVEWYLTYMACARGGFISTTVNPAYQASEIEYCINKVGVKVLVCAEGFKGSNFYEMLQIIHPNLPNDEPNKVESDKVPSLESIVFISDKSLKGVYNFEEIPKLGSESLIKEIQNNQHLISPDCGANIQFTSGTTGKPKATLATHFNIVNNSYEIAKRVEFNKKYYRICLQAPMFHALGSTIALMGGLNVGSTMVFAGTSYNPVTTLNICSQEGCTALHGTPTMYVDLVNVQNEKKVNLQLETAIMGGAPCSPHLFRQVKEVLKVKRVQSVYGLTETTAVIFQSFPKDDEFKATETVGHVSDHVEAKVVDKNGNMVPFGTAGELWVRGYIATLGYWGDEEKTKELIGDDRWLHTGDKFILEENGYGKIVGRIKDMIIRGGENIFPKEIEDFLNTHPSILESQVIGIPDERLGEEVCACLRLKNGTTLTVEELKVFCKGKIADFKIPKLIKIFSEFPKTASGKIQKFKLKESVIKI